MMRWFIGTFVVSLVVWNLMLQGKLDTRSRELEAAISLGERQVETIDRQIGAMQKQTEVLNECTIALNRLAPRSKTAAPSRAAN